MHLLWHRKGLEGLKPIHICDLKLVSPGKPTAKAQFKPTGRPGLLRREFMGTVVMVEEKVAARAATFSSTPLHHDHPFLVRGRVNSSCRGGLLLRGSVL